MRSTGIIEMDTQRNHYARHGLHMNSYGKSMLAREMAEVRRILHHKNKDRIILFWNDNKNVIEKKGQGEWDSGRTRNPLQKLNSF